ncbi:LysR family transcriptional regulator [Kaistia dalseonensis]|uniref:DNA-binding transcriptional LysR family regulator n=1 Tax=Kaistia dalseonensis TaxID=410840 RepID=A0ABU0HAX0_9HYPH|nr:LysR family transcriptional regulator [Kaistia dalseonensis]MCX5496830.1 LysR family transcriptional regulator [Kaistia dalseonensis]MDQ0439456.1 DNA-binding transcriptional LysR family regulator [Kaistia dalseonensis]
MTLEQLRIFVAVAERQHLTRAAADLRLTPSAVSAAIRVLEDRHGVALFHRVGRGIELSEAGTIFLAEAKVVLAGAERAETTLFDLAGLRRGSLFIKASQTIASYFLPPLLVDFHDAHPAVEIGLAIGNTETVAASVLDGTAQLGFIEGAIDEPALSIRAIAEDRLIVVVGPSHEWSDGRLVTRADLLRTRWIMRERGSGTRSSFEQALEAQGIEPTALDVALELPSNEAVRSAVERTALATVLSESVALPHIEAGRLKRAGFDAVPRLFSMIRHKERYRTRAALAFEELLLGR